MAYATTAAMIARFGEAEMIRLSAPEGELDGVVDAAAVGVALDDASDLVDSYLDERFALPLNPIPASITAATCAIARHALASGGGKSPGDQVTTAREEAIAWLKKLASGEAGLRGAALKASDARVQDRERITWPGTRGAY
jgi:phage gp36-like protein